MAASNDSSIPFQPDVVIVGAGIAGLSAATELVASGRRVVVLEKSRGVGGRMATRRVGEAICDHGAQFFTVRGPAFGGMVTEAHEAGSVATWCEGFSQAASVGAAVITTPPLSHTCPAAYSWTEISGGAVMSAWWPIR